ncbi:pathogenesis-related protein 1-like [Oryza brachyantha]|uniref:pathogenesis-related protein 1-like n=1 Tax=Oryza brachyantha TaxID=4533 RepID=UPI001AD973DF|nr:pathogenesis-related protein 1-like [Oryza brachyantha]
MMEAPKMGAAGAIAMLVAAVLAAATSSMAQNSPQDFVELHNVARSVEGLGDVVWDEAVAAYAESYAAERAGDCALIHSGSWEKAGYGENLFGGPGGEWTAADAVNSWVGEKELYDYDSNSCLGSWDSCLHYTQVVWRDSTAIGCARVVCDNDAGVFITCNYNPAGNVQGERPFERALTLSA